MRAKKGEIEFANVILRQGTRHLLDLADDVVLPTIFSGQERKTGKRAYRPARWFFKRPAVVDLGSNRYGVAFEFMKDWTLRSDQHLDENDELVPRVKRVATASAALGLTVLHETEHFLAYLPTTSFAPSVKELEKTLNWMMQSKLREELMGKVAAVEPDERLRKKALRAVERETEWPTLKLVALTNKESIAEALEHFAKVRSFTIRIEEPNPAEYEADSELFEMMKGRRVSTNAKKASVSFERRTGEGLNKEAVLEDAKGAADDPNTHLVIKGENADDIEIVRDNSAFAVRKPFKSDVGTPRATAPKMFEEIVEATKSLKLPKPAEQLMSKAKDLYEKWKNKK